MKHRRIAVIFSCLLILTLGPAAFGQSDRGTIVGTVKDPNGAVVADAKVTVTNLDSGEVREAKTSEDGTYTVPELKAAPYKLTVEASGFKTATIDKVQVAVQVTRRADVKLEVGGVGESVTITSDAPALQTDSPVQQTNVTEQQIRELPLQIGGETAGRSPIAFIFLDSSVATGGGSTADQNQSQRGTGTLGFNFRVNGGQGLGTEILVDGAPTRRAENGTFFTEVAPGPNAFQEFTVSTAQYSAEFGNSSGGVVNLTIKSGGNQFHGELYEFYRTKGLDANIDLNRLLGREKPIDQQHDYGFSVGGPIYLPRFQEGGARLKDFKNRAFFFFNYGGYKFTQSENANISVPTLRMRNGDFSELLTDPTVLAFFGGPVNIYDNTVPCCNRPAIPGNRLDLYRNAQGQSIISPAGQALMQLFPLPTGPGVYHNYAATSFIPTRTNYYVQKTDFVISSKQRLAFSSTYRVQTKLQGEFPRFPSPWVNVNTFNQTFHSQYYRLQDDYTFSATLLNHLNMGFTRSFVQNRNTTKGLGTPVPFGIPANATQNLALPRLDFPNYGSPVTSGDPRAYQGGGSTNFDNQDGDNSVQIADFVTWVKGRHTMKFGGEARWQQLNDSNHFDLGGWFNFQSNQTSNGNFFNQGWPIASLLTGAPEFSFNSVQSIDPGFRFFEPSFFFQDDIKVTPRLTVNVGVRYDIPYPRVEHLDKYRGFDRLAANPAIGGRLGAIAGAAGQGGVQSPYRGLIKPDYSDIGPRLGFAYTLNNKTVVRGGYGIYYAPLLYNDFGRGGELGYLAPGLHINGGGDAFIRLDNYPATAPVDPNSQFIGSDVEGFNRNFKNGRTAQWSLNIERQLPANFVVSVGYVGSKGTRLRSAFDPLNAIPLDALKLGNALLSKNLVDVTASDRTYAQSVGFTIPTCAQMFTGFCGGGFANINPTVAQSLKPFPQYGIITEHMESEGQSIYHALRLDLNRRFSQGIQVGVSYTFAKLITDAAEDLFGNTPISGVVQNPFDRSSLRTPSPNVVPHSFVVNYLFEVPFGKGKRFLNQGGVVDKVLGGWQISGVQRYRNGPLLVPFIAGGARDFLNLVGFNGNLRPNITGQPFYTDVPAGGIRYQYLNPAAFAFPAAFNGTGAAIGSPEYAAYYANPLRFFGNSAPTYSSLRGQPFFTEDFNILKKTRITETTTFEFRVDFFNAFNRGRFVLPGTDLNNPGTFGISDRVGDFNQPRHIQLGGRFIF